MPAEPGRAVSSSPPRARVAVIAALGVEHAALAKAGRDAREVACHQSGPGAARAAAAARAALAAGAQGLVSWGLAGGLIAELEAGSVVLPERVAVLAGGATWRVEPRWHAALEARLAAEFPIHTGTLVSVARVLASPGAKAEAAEAAGAVAADMESAAIAAVAAEARVPFAAVRVVADASTDSLPADVENWIDASGDRRILPVLGAALAPAQWPMLLALAGRYRIARRTLEDLARHLLASGFCLPQAESRAART